MYIKNIKEANFWLCFYETLFTAWITFEYFIVDNISMWLTVPAVIFGTIAIIITWADYIKNVTKKENN